MKNLLLLLILTGLFTSCQTSYNPPFYNPPWEGRPYPTAENPVPGMGGFEHNTLHSELMDEDIGYSIVLPGNYYMKEYADSSFPVIYFLHGITGTENADIWNSKFYYRAASEGLFPEVIMVFPNGMNEDYRDNQNGKLFIESHIITELIPYINREYRTNTDCVGITGFSMGGRGSLKLLLRHPEIFSYAVSIDGTLKNRQVDSLDIDELEKYGSVSNYNAYTTEVLLENLVRENPGIEQEIAVMMLSGEKRNERALDCSVLLDQYKIEHILISDTLSHNAELFYEMYYTEIMAFERSHLCGKAN